ncbi:MAG: TetR/AcrR family transcriptional regulator [Puniceicoccales bacterium]|jgi:AcrR family transcriptional regulator|nr:TetR/AcrR family transcriptional regulator [Puniceicoccales bacterium]
MSKPPKQDSLKRCNAQGEKTRRRILTTAGRLFAQNGYDSVGIRNVSDEMGIAPSLLIHHFGNKATLYQRTVEYFLSSGDIYLRAALPLSRVDIQDRQASANALAESIHHIFEEWHGPRRIRFLDKLMLQVIVGRGAVDVPLALKWIGPAEHIFEDFFRRVRPEASECEIQAHMEVFWGGVFYPGVIRELLCVENSWKEYPVEFLLEWKRVLARNFCLGLGLPAPDFHYPEETHDTPSIEASEV